MDPFKEKTVEILRVMALTGNERALDELLLRKDNEKDDAVAQARPSHDDATCKPKEIPHTDDNRDGFALVAMSDSSSSIRARFRRRTSPQLAKSRGFERVLQTNPHDFHSSYDVLLNNCQHFASLCRTGRRESWQLKAAAEAVLKIFASATKNIAQSKVKLS
eukprot:gene2854-4923_t